MDPRPTLRAQWPAYRRCRGRRRAEERRVQQILAARARAPRNRPADCRCRRSTHSGEQRLARARVIPVEEVPFVALQARERVHGLRTAIEKIVGGEIPEIARCQRRGQPQADVGRRGALRHFDAQRELRIVGRQPVRFGADQVVEEAPGAARRAAQESASRAVRDGTAARSGSATASAPATRPQNHERKRRGEGALPVKRDHHQNGEAGNAQHLPHGGADVAVRSAPAASAVCHSRSGGG